MPQRLKLKRINRFDLVDRGDNPHAHVALWKRHELTEEDVNKDLIDDEIAKMHVCLKCGNVEHGEKANFCPHCGNQLGSVSKKEEEIEKGKESQMPELPAEITALELSEDALKVIGKAYSDEVEKREAAEKAAADAKAEAEKVGKKEEDANLDPVQKALQGLPEEVKKAVDAQLESVTKRAEEAEQIAKAERDARLNAEWAEKAKKYQALGKDPVEFGKTLRTLHETSPDEFAKVQETLDAAVAQLDSAEIFKELGSGLPGEAGEGQAYAKMKAKADEIRKAEPTLTEQEALLKAAELYPDLQAEYTNEVRKSVRKGG